ncbi:MAG: ABC transporter substrate-binding protein [Candidatus Sumerlaeota bacterium]
MKRGRWIIPLMLLATALLLVLTVVDPAQKDASVQDRVYPRRIITLSSGLTELVFALGAGDRVVGVSDWSSYPAEVGFLPRCGDIAKPREDQILKLQPDLILVPRNAEGVQLFAARHDIASVSYEMDSVLAVMSNTLQIGLELGETSAAVALADRIRQDLERLRVELPEKRRPSVAIVLGRRAGPPSELTIAAKDTFLGQLLRMVGGKNAFHEARGYPVVSAGELQRANPDVIVEIRRGELMPGWYERSLMNDWSVLDGVRAVENQRIHILNQDFMLAPGPRVAQAGYTLLRAVHGEAFLLERETVEDTP